MPNVKIDAWEPVTIDLLVPDQGKKVAVVGRRAKCTLAVDDFNHHSLTLTAFVTPTTRRVWIGPQQDCYVDATTEVVGLQIHPAAILVWHESLVRSSDEHAANLDRVISSFSQTITRDELRDHLSTVARVQSPGGSRRFKLSLHEYLRKTNPFFFTSAPFASQAGTPHLISTAIDDGNLKIVITNQSGEYKATLWIDVNDRKILKGECDPATDRFDSDHPPQAK